EASVGNAGQSASPVSNALQRQAVSAPVATMVRQHMADIEEPGFVYRPLNGEERRKEVIQLVQLAKQACRTIDRQLEQKLGRTGKRWLSSLVAPGPPDEVVEWKRTQHYLRASVEELCGAFKLNKDTELSSLSLNGHEPVSLFASSRDVTDSTLGRNGFRQCLDNTKAYNYQGNPDTEPIRSYEVVFLVRLLHLLSTAINDKYGPRLQLLYSSPPLCWPCGTFTAAATGSLHRGCQERSRHTVQVPAARAARPGLPAVIGSQAVHRLFVCPAVLGLHLGLRPLHDLPDWAGVLLREPAPQGYVVLGSTAALAARYLGKPTGSDDDVATDIFFAELASRVGGLAGFLDLMYQQHPRLRAFLIGLLLGVVALLGAAVPLALVACATGGRVPLPWRPTAPRCCLVCCVLLGLIALFTSADLTTMMTSQAALADALRVLPAAFQRVTDEVRRYANQTVGDLLTELADADVTVSEGVKNFLYQVLPNETVARISSVNCLTASSAVDSIATKLRRCKNVPARMLLPGAVIPKAVDLIREDLQLQLNRTLASVDRLEVSIAAFEQRAKLWSKATIVDVVATPVVMVLLCINVALLGIGIASASATNFCEITWALALALAVAITLSVAALPLVLIVSQFFHAAREDGIAMREGGKARPSASKQLETSREELFAEEGSTCMFSSRRHGFSADMEPNNRGRRSRRPRSRCLPIVGKPRRPRHDKSGREESVEFICGGKSSRVDDSSSLISTEQATATEVCGLPRANTWTPKLISTISRESLVSYGSPTRLGTTDAAVLPRRCPSSDLINEYYPRFSPTGHHSRRFRSRFALMGKASRKTSLGTIQEEPEPISESELSMLTALSAISDEWCFTRNTTPSDKGGEEEQFVSADAFQLPSPT
ncbi:hypothetical protein MTO96_036542, partial [Rhipicephalus appendiculatus]